MAAIRSEGAANAYLSDSAIDVRWLEPSRTTRMRVNSTRPKSILGKAISLFWGWL